MAEKSSVRQKALAVALVNDFIHRSFRDVADRDYIAARTVHRHGGLELQFLWLAQQAVEKYLKAILLYNRRSAKGIGHSLRKAYAEVLKIKDILFDFPEDVVQFINYLERFGNNRYFEYPYSLSGEECLQLDRTVWFIRRYCRYMHEIIQRDGTIVNILARELERIHNPYATDNPNKLEVPGGFLEKVLKNKRSPLRQQLVWKNFYYGSYKKRIIKYKLNSYTANSPLTLHPGVYQELKELVKFSTSVYDHFSSSPQQPPS